MVSGLKGKTYEDKLVELGLPTLEERRHQTDMLQTFKIVRGIDRVDSSTVPGSNWLPRQDEQLAVLMTH